MRKQYVTPTCECHQTDVVAAMPLAESGMIPGGGPTTSFDAKAERFCDDEDFDENPWAL